MFRVRFQDSQVDPEAAITPKTIRKRKTTHNDLGQGSFFLRVGAIGKYLVEFTFNEDRIVIGPLLLTIVDQRKKKKPISARNIKS